MFIWNVELAWNFNKRRLHSSPYVGHLKLCAEEKKGFTCLQSSLIYKKGSVVTRIYVYTKCHPLTIEMNMPAKWTVFFLVSWFFLSLPRCHFLLCFAMIQVDILYSIINMQHYIDLLLFLFDSISEIDEIATVTRKRPVSWKSINLKSQKIDKQIQINQSKSSNQT